MRYIQSLNQDWLFKRTEVVPSELPTQDDSFEEVTLPHTWNNIDGQNGGANYYRGKGSYTKVIKQGDFPSDYNYYLEFEGVNSIAEVYVNGDLLKEHRGGYSTFRVDVTDYLKNGDALLAVIADNAHYDDVYPQVADFTFYGGIYRHVNLIAVPETHFDLEFNGAPGVAYSSTIHGDNAVVSVEAWIDNPQWSDQFTVEITDEQFQTVAEVTIPASEHVEAELFISDAHLWQGVEDPYLYNISARIVRGNDVIDSFDHHLGIREYHVDPEKGFFLNGKSMPLRGVARHQDKRAVGNALSEEDMWLDAELIYELGANTIRLAHYQHSHTFYDICDQLGFVVWAEIPFISVMNKEPKAHKNAVSQMKELVYQNYNHPSILFWGISNEITIGGDIDGLQENLEELNKLTKEIDPTRDTTIAQVSMLPTDSKQNQITDTVSYNHYFGWYGGDFDQNDKWFDKFHSDYPEIPIGISEYGSEGIITWHSNNPVNQDYTEEYQTAYHEHMAQMIADRPYLWATHIWNVFDFGADNRDEGGIAGRNNKGLISFDRRIKKDSFYVYKAYWSNDPFVHVAQRRFSQRDSETIDVKVYTNQDEVTLYVDGEAVDTKQADKIVIFENVPLKEDGFTFVTAKAGKGLNDSVSFQRVDELPASYTKPEEQVQEYGAQNWFDDLEFDNDVPEYEFKDGYFSVNDKMSDIIANDEAVSKIIPVAEAVSGMKINPKTFAMMNHLPLKDLESIFGKYDDDNTKLRFLNAELQKIKK